MLAGDPALAITGSRGSLTSIADARRHVLCLLVIGVSRLVIADLLYLGSRTVDLRIAEIKRMLGTSQSLCMGVRAVRRGYVDPRHPVRYARAQRPGSDWIEPTSLQLEIIHQLAEDASVDDVAKEISICVRTVRNHVARLAAANGAQNYIAAGALFEALGWLASARRERR